MKEGATISKSAKIHIINKSPSDGIQRAIELAINNLVKEYSNVANMKLEVTKKIISNIMIIMLFFDEDPHAR